MPLYEYFCKDCQKEFTLLQSVRFNREETTCEHCGSSQVDPHLSGCSTKVQGSTKGKAKPATIDDYPNKTIFKLPRPRHVSEY